MAKRKGMRRVAGILFFVSAAGVLAMIISLSLLPEGSKDARARIVWLSSLAVLICFAGLVILAWNRKRQQVQTWRQVVSILEKPSARSTLSHPPRLQQMSQEDLQEFTIEIFRDLGYRFLRRDPWTGGKSIAIMTNPEGEREIIGCSQQLEPVGLGQVCALYDKMNAWGARRSILWAPGGFRDQAVSWARGKPILLADPQEIERLVSTIRGNAVK